MMSESRRCMGIDYGFRRIGIALSDPLGMIARPHVILQRKTNKTDFARIGLLVENEQVSKIVVGLPTDAEGDIGPQAERVIRWASKLAEVVATPIIFWDESHSSEQAAALRGSSRSFRRAGGHPERVDDAAAAVILQEYLDAGGAINEPGQPLNTLTGEN
jgi:putative holliday junction resolvase